MSGSSSPKPDWDRVEHTEERFARLSRGCDHVAETRCYFPASDVLQDLCRIGTAPDATGQYTPGSDFAIGDVIPSDAFVAYMPADGTHNAQDDLFALVPQRMEREVSIASHTIAEWNDAPVVNDAEDAEHGTASVWEAVERFKEKYKNAQKEITRNLDSLVERLPVNDRHRFRMNADMCREIVELKKDLPLPMHITTQYIATVDGFMPRIVDAFVDSMIREH